jgi:uncharacterized protein YndB with AHSA1/START domain
MIDKTLIKINVEIDIEAEPSRVFSAITTGTAIWWSAPHLQRPNASDLVLEPKIGGRFYERWTISNKDTCGALHATVTAIEAPNLLRLQGPFGMTERAVLATATIELKPIKKGTHVHFSFHAFGELDEALEVEYGRGWADLLGRLKFFVEEGKAEGIRHDPSLTLD